MVRSRARFLGGQINSNKNIVQDVAIIAAAGNDSATISSAEDTAALAVTSAVTRGCKINTIYLEVWIYGSAVAGVNSPVTWALWKDPGDSLGSIDPATAGTDVDKKWIFAMGKGLIGNQANGQPGYLIRGWFSIPKKMRRQGAEDKIRLNIKNDTANNLNVCRLFIYKWYT